MDRVVGDPPRGLAPLPQLGFRPRDLDLFLEGRRAGDPTARETRRQHRGRFEKIASLHLRAPSPFESEAELENARLVPLPVLRKDLSEARAVGLVCGSWLKTGVLKRLNG